MSDRDLAGESSQIGEQLRAARRAANLTQADAAAALGVNPMTVSKRERGDRGISADEFVRVMAIYESLAEARAKKLSRNVPRGTIDRASEPAGEYVAVSADDDDSWSPNPALKNKIPPRAYEVAMGYCRRLLAAGIPRENIEEVERVMVDRRFQQANKRLGHELTEDEWIMLVDATWSAVRSVLDSQGIHA